MLPQRHASVGLLRLPNGSAGGHQLCNADVGEHATQNILLQTLYSTDKVQRETRTVRIDAGVSCERTGDSGMPQSTFGPRSLLWRFHGCSFFVSYDDH